MRLPADATLIVVGAPPADAGCAPKMVAALVDAWRREDLPVVDAPGERAPGAGGFAEGRLESLLDDLGATTLVLCGEAVAVGAVARDAAALGFHLFIVRDACWRVVDLAPGARSGDGGTFVDTATALAAAAVAKARQRRDGRRPRPSRPPEE